MSLQPTGTTRLHRDQRRWRPGHAREYYDDVEVVCLHCLLEDGDEQLGDGLDLAKRYGQVDYDPEARGVVRAELTGFDGIREERG